MRNIPASIGWYCVHIEHIRLVKSVDLTFRNLLRQECAAMGEPPECRVYRYVHRDESRSYYFSPQAVAALRAFIIFWDGFGVSRPHSAVLANMELIIPILPVSDSPKMERILKDT